MWSVVGLSGRSLGRSSMMFIFQRELIVWNIRLACCETFLQLSFSFPLAVLRLSFGFPAAFL